MLQDMELPCGLSGLSPRGFGVHSAAHGLLTNVFDAQQF